LFLSQKVLCQNVK